MEPTGSVDLGEESARFRFGLGLLASGGATALHVPAMPTLPGIEVAAMVEAVLAGIQGWGKARVGDKTVLDALTPAAEALRSAADAGLPLAEALQKSLAAAEERLRSTIPMKSKIGRASWIAERTVGHQDPGATSFCLMFKSAVESLTELPAK